MNRELAIIQKIFKISAVYNIYLNQNYDENELYKICQDAPKIIIQEFKLDQEEEIKQMFLEAKPVLKGYFREILNQKSELEEIVSRNLDKWRFKRLNTIVKSLLITSVYDFYNTNRSKNVIFNETLEIAKIYLTEPEKNFINKILDKVINDSTFE